MILVVLQEEGCWRTLSALRKYGGTNRRHSRWGETGEETVEDRKTTDLPGCGWVRSVQKVKGFRQDFDANTEFRHSASSRAVSAVRPFEVREGMEGQHTIKTDLIRRHQDLEEGDRFENSDLR